MMRNFENPRAAAPPIGERSCPGADPRLVLGGGVACGEIRPAVGKGEPDGAHGLVSRMFWAPVIERTERRVGDAARAPRARFDSRVREEALELPPPGS